MGINLKEYNYKKINMPKKKMKYEFRKYIKFRLGIRYEVYENDDSFMLRIIKKKTNEILNEKIFVCRL